MYLDREYLYYPDCCAIISDCFTVVPLFRVLGNANKGYFAHTPRTWLHPGRKHCVVSFLHPYIIASFLPIRTPGCFSSAIFTPTLFDDDKSRCVLSDWPTFRCHSPSYCIIMFIFGSCAPATCPCVLVSFLRFCSERVARANRRSSAPPMQPANPPPPPPPGKCNPA